MNTYPPEMLIRAMATAAFLAVVVIGLAGDWYEPSYQWVVPVAVVGAGLAIGRWWALWLALVPVMIAIPEGTGGDPPALPAAVIGALLGLGLLAFGVALSIFATTALRRYGSGEQRR